MPPSSVRVPFAFVGSREQARHHRRQQEERKKQLRFHFQTTFLRTVHQNRLSTERDATIWPIRQFVEIANYLLETDALWSRFCESAWNRSARPTRLHNKVTIATVMIHRSNLARSIVNSMSAAKRIERDAIRFIMQVQIQEIHRTRILLNALVPFPVSHQCLSPFAIAGSRRRGRRFEITSRQAKSISLSQR